MQHVERPEVRGRLQEPALAGPLPLEQPQQVGVVAVGGPQVLRLEPARVGLHQRLDAHLRVAERVRGEQHALLGHVDRHVVDLVEVRVLLAVALVELAERLAARIGRAGGKPFERIGEEALPEEERAVARIGRRAG